MFTHQLHLFSTLTMLIIVLILFWPLLSSFAQPTIKPNPSKKTETAVKISFFVSLIPLMLFIDQGMETLQTHLTLLNIQPFQISISMQIDQYTLLFTPIALYVTWSILQFAQWYMHEDPEVGRFFKYLLLFLAAMILLVTADNLFHLFIGWEGVGVMSFLLIGWWYGRANANTAALQAIIFNRIGDVGLIIALAWMAIHVGSWNIHELPTLTSHQNLTIPLLGFVLAAAGKSAQFGLHPWLPSAMEGPTPVSALLHSSTMVVAGIILLVRVSPLMENNPNILTLCLCLGALTSLFTATCALSQNDIKKIIAFSTSSQLGLMMVAIGLNQPQLAFFHIAMHAFFKAMLFMCAGSIIHSLDGEQDIRKMGGTFPFLPFTSACFTLGSLALMGTPFLAGFFSKDPIIEAMNTSNINAWALLLVLVATSFTAVYSLRLIYYVVWGHPRFTPLSPIDENNPLVINPLKRLAWGSITAGFLLASFITPMKTPPLTLSPLLKISALVVTILAFLFAYEIAKLTTGHLKLSSTSPSYKFFTLLGFYPSIVHRTVSDWFLRLALKLSYETIDQNWLEKSAPKMISALKIPLASYVSNIQRGQLPSTLSSLTFFLAVVMLLYNV